MRKKIMQFLIRFFCIAFWIGLIFLFLLSPYVGEYFKDRRSINIMTWTELLDPKIITEFEKETGIKVYLSYFDNNEELYAKVKATKAQGYDLLLPSDYIVEYLINDNLIQKIDKAKLTMWDRFDKRLLNNFYDLNNEYSIPFVWQMYGLAIDKSAFGGKTPTASWDLLFDKSKIPGTVVMMDTARENILLAAQYLFGSIENLDEKKVQQIKELLVRQKQWVEVYTEMRADYLLTSHICPVVLSVTPLMWRLVRDNSWADFIVPPDATFIIVDNFVIPKVSDKKDLVYQFLNFIYKAHVLEHHFNNYRFFPATTDLFSFLKKYNAPQSIINAVEEYPGKLKFFENVLPESVINEVWINLKAF